jgi:hypothetical protein
MAISKSQQIFLTDLILSVFMSDNDKDHRPRASDARLETTALSRGSVHPIC